MMKRILMAICLTYTAALCIAELNVHGKARTPAEMYVTHQKQAESIDTNCVLWIAPVDDLNIAGTYYDYSDGTRSSTNDGAQSTAGYRPAYSNIGTNNGQVSYAYDFDGSDDYIDIANTSFNFDLSDEFSICGWAKSHSSGVCVLAAKGLASGTYRGYQLIQLGTELRYDVISTFGSDYISKTVPLDITDGAWRFFCFTYDGTATAAGTLLYVNGVLQSASVNGDNLVSTITNSVNFQIGAKQGEQNWDGCISAAQVFSVALTSNQQSVIYSDTKSRYGL